MAARAADSEKKAQEFMQQAKQVIEKKIIHRTNIYQM
tara:strand:+ start:169 stop:279 length:111 start_codon:yes stop_codon:yes gene_type:complete